MKKVNPFWGILCLVTVLAAVALSFIGYNKGILYARPEGNPQDTVCAFFDCVTEKDYEGAYSLLNGYTSLGLEDEPEDSDSQQMMHALRTSYSYELSGTAVRKGITATQKIILTRLNVPAVSSAALAITDREYSVSLSEFLSSPEAYYTSDILDISLKYVNGKWLIEPDSALLTSLSGGIL